MRKWQEVQELPWSLKLATNIQAGLSCGITLVFAKYQMRSVVNKKDQFIAKLKEIYPENSCVLDYLSEPKVLAFRINSLKNNLACLDELKSQGFSYKQGPIKDTYILTALPDNCRISETPAFKNGNIYIQSLSSMLPALVLDPKPGNNVLDLCASPGSKTSQIAVLTNNEAQITAVENNRNRFFALMANMKNLSVVNVDYILENGLHLLATRPNYLNYFDKVLVDAPCSNEAHILLSDSKSLERWNSKVGKHLSKLQKGLLNAGFAMLKTGGTLVYSTCTYSVDENEEVVNWALHKNTNASLDDINLHIEGLITQPGLVSWKDKDLNPLLAKTIRILPSPLFNGFFIAKFIKMQMSM
jgi:NOL1/NOP2/sun family putative RNA methylase